MITGERFVDSRNNMITGVDKLLTFVNEREEASLKEASKELKIPLSVIERWTNTLEEEGLLTTAYTFNEKYILSTDSPKFKQSLFKSLKRTVKSIYKKSKTPHLDPAKAKGREIDSKITLLNEKMKDYEDYKRIKKQTLMTIKELKELKADRKKFINKIFRERT